ncbi:MAG: PAS domain S-box protein [Candidatus Hydrogenedentes bacterium]|nr:PAS domain S-box protein [Candidatus Hydrogenedentota bacterium]
MTKTTKSASKGMPRPGVLFRSRYWTVGAVAVSLLVCALMTTLHFQHGLAMQSALDDLENLRQARIDLGKGFLHLSLDGDASTPFDHEEGLVLLRQAVTALGKSLSRLGRADAETVAAFRDNVARFEGLLDQWRGNDAHDSAQAVELRIAFHELERQADQVDRQVSRGVQEMAGRLDNTYLLALAASAALLAVMCVFVFLGARENMRASAMLRRGEERWRGYIENAPYAVFVTDSQGNYVEVNPEACRVTGYDEAELLTKSIPDLLAPESRETGQESFSALQRDGRVYTELLYATKGGEKRWWSVAAVKLDDTRCLGYANDITENKRAGEQELQAAREWQTTFDSIRDAVWLLDRDFRIVRCNRATEILMGKAMEELMGVECWRVFHGTATPPQMCLAARIRTSMKRETSEQQVDGRWFRAVADPILDANGDLCGVVHSASDITELRQMERNLRRLAAAIEQSANAIIITDTGGIIQYVNPAFEVITGYGQDEALGQHSRMLKSDGHDGAFFRQLWETISGGKTWKGRIISRRKNGGLYTAETSISPVCGTTGEILHYVAVQNDVTREEELERQLHQSQKMEAIGQLAGGVAHDFNNILQAMMGYSQILMDAAQEKGESCEELEEIFKGSVRAAALTRQLLSFSRKQEMCPEPLDFNQAVEDLLKMLRRVIGADIRLEWLPGSLPGLIHADRGMMEQVLMNLCVNARDAMPAGGVITVDTKGVTFDAEYCAAHVWAKPGRFVVLSVADTGCGMDRATMDRIFEPFFTTKAEGKGTGLGLATVYGIVRQHEGMVNVYSEPGKGTTFKVYLPVYGGEDAAMTGPAPKTAPAGGGETILLAEDDEMVRNLAVTVLTRAGYQVLTANDGMEAVALFKQHMDGVSLLLLDIIMPNLGGHEALREMRALRPDVPALFSSGYSEHAVQTDFVLGEGLALIHKPYAPRDLLRAVRDALDKKKT